ncbi:uncharacterized protein Fot_44235 [Forsythia ovata]|uniref:Uncharacterized protein n=1 Tax=Forsythia ovata TaxID=205694 RepID=A0ABD1R3X1_9LAMI
MGITMSAFFLFLLEYVGKHLCGLLKLCSEAQEGLRLMVQSIWSVFRYKVDKLDGKNASVLRYEVLQDEYFNPDCSGSKKDCGLSSSIQETQNVEPKHISIAITEEIHCDKEMMDESSHDGKLGYEELESNKVIIEKE